MSSSLLVYNRANSIQGPRSVLIDRTPIGYTDEDGVDFQPSWDTQPVAVDQEYAILGHNITGVAGTVGIKVWEMVEGSIALLHDLAAAASISSPIAGADFGLTPGLQLTNRLIEWWGLWANGGVGHYMVKGALSAPPAQKIGRKTQMIWDLKYALTRFSSGYPGGLLRLYDAVSGAVTFTSVPADNATGVLGAAAPTFTFNKPMSALALLNEHGLFLKHEDLSEVAFVPSFGTVVKDGVTVTDPTKIVLTPASALTASKVYDITVYQGIPAVDGTTLAADSLVDFTVAT